MLSAAGRGLPFKWSQLDRVVRPDDASLTSMEWCPPPPYTVRDAPIPLKRGDSPNPQRGMREINLANTVLSGCPHDAFNFEEQESGGHGQYSYVTNRLTDDEVTAKYGWVRYANGMTLMPTPAPPMCKYGCDRSTVATDERITRHHLCNEPGGIACRQFMQRKADLQHDKERKRKKAEKKKADAKEAKAAKAAKTQAAKAAKAAITAVTATTATATKSRKGGKAGKVGKAGKGGQGGQGRAAKAAKAAKAGNAGNAGKAPKPKPSKASKRKIAFPHTPENEEGEAEKQDEAEMQDEAEKQWVLEGICGERVSDTGQVEFLVKWEGCGDSENSWEPASGIDADATIAAFRCVNNSNIGAIANT